MILDYKTLLPAILGAIGCLVSSNSTAAYDHWHCGIWHGHIHHHCYFHSNEIPLFVNLCPSLHPVHIGFPQRKPAINVCTDFKDSRISFFGPCGFLMLQPVQEKLPRVGEGSMSSSDGGLDFFEIEEIINAPSGFMYYEVKRTSPPDSPLLGMILRIACKGLPNGRFPIFIRHKNASDFKFLMDAHFSHAQDYGYTALLRNGERGDVTPKLASLLQTNPTLQSHTSALTKAHNDFAYSAKRFPANPIVPKSRIVLKGRWYTPAETKIVTSWQDRSERLEVVQILPSNSKTQYTDTKPALVVSTRRTKRTE